MANRGITTELYNRLLLAYADKPCNKKNACRVAGVGREFADRAWNTGWPKKGFPPIRQMFNDANTIARAKRELDEIANAPPPPPPPPPPGPASWSPTADDDKYVQAEHQRLLAIHDAAKAHEEEAKMLKSARGSAAFLLTRTLRLLDRSRAMQEHTEALLTKNVEGMSLGDCLATMGKLGKLSEQAVALAREAMAMERLFMGKPMAIVEHQVDMTGMSDEMLDQELAMVHAALVSAKSRYGSNGSNGNGQSQHASLAVLTDHGGNGSAGGANGS